jgi:predicted PurR-regulated permease PerM
MPNPLMASYLLAACAVPLVLHFHLLSAVFAGLAVHVLTVKLARKLPTNWSKVAHEVALGILMMIVILLVFGCIFGLWSFLRGNHGIAALMAALAETIERLRQILPGDVTMLLPDSVDDLREQLSKTLHEHSHNISVAGIAGFKTFAHILLGMVVGGMTALHHFDKSHEWPQLADELHARAQAMAQAFDKVVFAQVKISGLNTLLTALYLLLILPLCGIHLPLVAVLIPFTFAAGLIPVIGNLVSNTAIVLLSLGVSPGAGAGSLLFLILIHKLEYFTNARIVGGEVHARAWELLCAMLFMEAVFGMVGLVVAPVVYAWIKAELTAREMI